MSESTKHENNVTCQHVFYPLFFLPKEILDKSYPSALGGYHVGVIYK